MKTKIKKIAGGIVLAVMVLMVPISAYAIEYGCNKTYSLRQLTNQPSSNVKNQTFEFLASSGTVTVTCTQNTTSGASVSVTITSQGNTVTGTLNTAGASLSLPVTPQQYVKVTVTLNTPNTYDFYQGIGTVVN
ncbi:MAG: hypothetical protein J1E83_09170 [Lachnospiraceae bacterium]|nr:hypothetical protein [Lachnospiraceae bacterium]